MFCNRVNTLRVTIWLFIDMIDYFISEYVRQLAQRYWIQLTRSAPMHTAEAMKSILFFSIEIHHIAFSVTINHTL